MIYKIILLCHIILTFGIQNSICQYPLFKTCDIIKLTILYYRCTPFCELIIVINARVVYRQVICPVGALRFSLPVFVLFFRAPVAN